MSAVVTAVGVATAHDAFADFDPNRLRRMDRFGRFGFVAGSRALRHAGYRKASPPDPGAGVVWGTAYGCRDSITEHALLLRTARSVEDLRPAVFAETVHNSVAGELAIEWGLGGVSETLTSGATAGLEAILLATRRLEAGAAERIVAGRADAFHPDTISLGNPLDVAEGGLAVVLESRPARPGDVLVADGVTFFEPDADERERRLAVLLGPVRLDLGEALSALFDGRLTSASAVRCAPSGAVAALRFAVAS